MDRSKMKLLDRIQLLFQSARYYGEGRKPSMEMVAALMGDLRSFVFAAGWDTDQLNRLVNEREVENREDLMHMGIDPVVRAAQAAHRRIEPVPEVTEEEKKETQAAVHELEQRRQQRLRKLKEEGRL